MSQSQDESFYISLIIPSYHQWLNVDDHSTNESTKTDITASADDWKYQQPLMIPGTTSLCVSGILKNPDEAFLPTHRTIPWFYFANCRFFANKRTFEPRNVSRSNILFLWKTIAPCDICHIFCIFNEAIRVSFLLQIWQNLGKQSIVSGTLQIKRNINELNLARTRGDHR